MYCAKVHGKMPPSPRCELLDASRDNPGAHIGQVDGHRHPSGRLQLVDVREGLRLRFRRCRHLVRRSLRRVSLGQLAIPSTHDVGQRHPVRPALARPERIAVNDDGGDVQQSELDIGHVGGRLVDVNRGDVQALLVRNALVVHRLGSCDHHAASTASGFLEGDETIPLDLDARAAANLGHQVGDGVGREELALPMVAEFERHEDRPETVVKSVLQGLDDAGQHDSKALNLFLRVAAHDLQVARLARGPLGQVA
jgi:hypothetical protein